MELWDDPQQFISSGDYWHMVALAPEWTWMVMGLERDYPTPEEHQGPPEYILYMKGSRPLYLIHKARVPFDILKARLGLPEEATEETCSFLVLNPLSNDKTLPEPTVGYIGES